MENISFNLIFLSSKTVMRNKVVGSVMVVLLFISAFFLWFLVKEAVVNPNASTWAAPIAVSLVFFFTFFSCIVLVRESAYLEIFLIIAFFLSLIFSPTLIHFGFLIVSIILASFAMHDVKQNLKSSVRIHFYKSFMSGRSYCAFALIFAIASQYYGLVRSTDGEKSIPKFEISKNLMLTLGKAVAYVDPKYSFLSSGQGLTVDEFILQNQNTDFLGQDSKQVSTARNLILEQGRKQLSQLSGAQLSGTEKIDDVFLEFTNKKINNYFSSDMGKSEKSSSFPLILTSILFITLLPLGTVIGYMGIALAAFLCGFMLKKGLIKTKITQIQVETLE